MNFIFSNMRYSIECEMLHRAVELKALEMMEIARSRSSIKIYRYLRYIWNFTTRIDASCCRLFSLVHFTDPHI